MVLKDCSRCMVYTPKGVRLSEARVVHTKGSVSLFFDNYKLKDARFHSRVDFYDNQAGLIICLCETTIRRNPYFPEMKEPWMAECRILDVKDIVQRQRDIRARVCLELGFTSEKHGKFFGTIKNISAGGMYMTTTQPLEQNEVITFSYSFRNLERPIEAVPLWVKRVEGGRYGYGCQFRHLTDGAEAAIRSFVYKKLMEKEKDKG